MRPDRAARGRDLGVARRRNCGRRGLRRLVHLLEPGDHRRGLRVAHRVRGRDAASAAAVAASALHGAPLCVLRCLRARLREPPVDGSPRPRVRGLSPVGRAAGLAFDARAARRRAGGAVRVPRRRAVRVGLHGDLGGAAASPRCGRRRRALLVRRDESRLARHDGPEPSAVDASRSPADVLVRSPAAVRSRPARRRSGRTRLAVPERLAARRPRAARLPGDGALRLQLQRRRHARLLPAVTRVHRAAPCGVRSGGGAFVVLVSQAGLACTTTASWRSFWLWPSASTA